MKINMTSIQADSIVKEFKTLVHDLSIQEAVERDDVLLVILLELSRNGILHRQDVEEFSKIEYLVTE